MIDIVSSLTLASGALVVAVVSAIFALVWARLTSAALKWGLAFGVPLGVSYVLYWLPVWFGARDPEYAAWAPVFIAPWALAGVAAASLVIMLDARLRRS